VAGALAGPPGEREDMLAGAGPASAPDTRRLSEAERDILLFRSRKRRMSPFCFARRRSIHRITLQQSWSIPSSLNASGSGHSRKSPSGQQLPLQSFAPMTGSDFRNRSPPARQRELSPLRRHSGRSEADAQAWSLMGGSTSQELLAANRLVGTQPAAMRSPSRTFSPSSAKLMAPAINLDGLHDVKVVSNAPAAASGSARWRMAPVPPTVGGE